MGWRLFALANLVEVVSVFALQSPQDACSPHARRCVMSELANNESRLMLALTVVGTIVFGVMAYL